MEAFQRFTRGFALYRLNDGSIDSIMKVTDSCRTILWGPDMFTLSTCGKDEVTSLKKFKQWEPSLQAVFPNKWKSIDAAWTVDSIGVAESAYPPGGWSAPHHGS